MLYSKSKLVEENFLGKGWGVEAFHLVHYQLDLLVRQQRLDIVQRLPEGVPLGVEAFHHPREIEKLFATTFQQLADGHVVPDDGMVGLLVENRLHVKHGILKVEAFLGDGDQVGLQHGCFGGRCSDGKGQGGHEQGFTRVDVAVGSRELLDGLEQDAFFWHAASLQHGHGIGEGHALGFLQVAAVDLHGLESPMEKNNLALVHDTIALNQVGKHFGYCGFGVLLECHRPQIFGLQPCNFKGCNRLRFIFAKLLFSDGKYKSL